MLSIASAVLCLLKLIQDYKTIDSLGVTWGELDQEHSGASVPVHVVINLETFVVLVKLYFFVVDFMEYL